MSRSQPAVLCLASVLAHLVAAGGAHGAGTHERIEQARQQYAAQEYERVIRLLEPVLRDDRAAIGQKIDVLEMVGLAHLILGHTRQARDAFENLLALDPAHELRDPSGSPKLRGFFETVKRSFVPGYGRGMRVILQHATPSPSRAGEAAEWRADVTQGAVLVRRVVLSWRRGAATAFHHVTMQQHKSRYIARMLLPDEAGGYTLQYYIEAQSARGRALAHAGSEDQPIVLRVRGRPRQQGQAPRRGGAVPLYRRWWFWTAIGAALIGGTAAAIGAASSTTPSGNLPPGTLTLP